MSLEKTAVSLSSKILFKLDDNTIIKFIDNTKINIENFDFSDELPISSQELAVLYQLSRRHQKWRVLDALWEHPHVQKKFEFLEQFNFENNYSKLAWPDFSTFDSSLEDICKIYFRDFWTPAFRSAFLSCLSKYGTVFLNNLIELRFVIKPYNLVSEVFKLDHTKEIDGLAHFPSTCYRELLKHYGLKKVFRLMTEDKSIDDDTPDYLYETLSELDGLPVDLKSSLLPTKPRSLKSLEGKLSSRIAKQQSVDHHFQQEINFLQGLIVDDFTIEVPTSANSLIRASNELKNCLETYVLKVLSGKTNVLFLKKNSSLIFAIEMKKDERGVFRFVQFKGKENEDSYEGEPGKNTRLALAEMIRLKGYDSHPDIAEDLF